MEFSHGILFGIVAMFGWGTADFLVAKAVRKTSVFKTFLWSQVFGLVLFLVIYELFFQLPTLSIATIGILLLTGVLGVIGYLAFYKGLQIGKVSVISPVAASWSLLTIILSALFLNETLTHFQLFSIALVILGIITVSMKFHDLTRFHFKNLTVGIEYAILSFFCWGINFFLIGILVAELSWFLPLFLLKGVMVLYMLGYSETLRKNIDFPISIPLFIALIGALEVVAFLSYGFAVSSGLLTSIIAPIASAFPMVTILLARIFLRERLELNQKFGVVAVLTGIILLSM